MFNTNNISYNNLTGQYICSCIIGSAETVQNIQTDYPIFVQEGSGFTIKIDGSAVTIASSNQNIVRKVANQINNSYFEPPLDVFVFYGYSKKGLESRWCVGFNDPDASNLIKLINTQDRFVQADKASMLWTDNSGRSYSIVMPTSVKESDPPRESINRQVNACLTVIKKVTFRKLNTITIKQVS